MEAPRSPPNGHAKDRDAGEAANYSPETRAVYVPPQFSGNQRFPQLKDFCAALEIPFDPEVIDWRVTNTTRNGKLRGYVIPYADRRPDTDRLKALLAQAGWTRKYAIHTSANFERSRDQNRRQGAVTREWISSALVRIRPPEQNGPTMTTPAQARSAGFPESVQLFRSGPLSLIIASFLNYCFILTSRLQSSSRNPRGVDAASPDFWSSNPSTFRRPEFLRKPENFDGT